MLKTILAALLGVLALTIAGAASAGPFFGFAEDQTKYGNDGGESLFAEMNKLGANTNRVAVFWNADTPTTIYEQAALDRMIPLAKKHNIQIVFDIYPLKATQAPTTPAAADQFCNYAVQVMQRYPSVKKVVIGNEPNQPRFWQPIWNSDGSPASPAAMEVVLASCYDKLKALDPTIDVIGVGISPRGNDDPKASSNASISPVRWIAALGKAYRASGRTAPLFDEWSWHCYPNVNTDEVEVGYAWPNTGCVNAARVKLALWDAFHGTGQPVPAGYPSTRTSAGLFDSLKLFIDETGWQVDTSSASGYSGTENVPTISEAKQAQDYEKLVHLANCEPTLTDFLIFHEIDESDRGGFQSGVLRADSSERPSATDPTSSVQHALAADKGGCSGVWQTLGSFLYSSTAVVPVYKTFPYQSQQPFVSKTTAGGGLYVALQAGEGFSYAVTFTSGSKSTTVKGVAPSTTATVKAPSGYTTGTASVVLTAETDPARTTTVTLNLVTGATTGGTTGSGTTSGVLLKQLTAPYGIGSALAFDGKYLYASDAGGTFYELDPATGRSLGTIRIGWNERWYGGHTGSVTQHYCCVQPVAADFWSGTLYISTGTFLFSARPALDTRRENSGDKLWYLPLMSCAAGSVGGATTGFAVLGAGGPAGVYAFSGQSGSCAVLSTRVKPGQAPPPSPVSGAYTITGQAEHTGDFAVNDPAGGITGLAHDGGNAGTGGLWIALSNGGDSKIVHYTRDGKAGASFSIPNYVASDLAYDAKTFAPKCALWVNEAAQSGAARIRAYAVPCG